MTHLRLFLILMLLGIFVIMTAFVAYAFPIIPLDRYAILITLMIVGSILYFLSILYLSKKKYAVVMVIGWIVIVLLNIYVWRERFFIICRPSYPPEDLENKVTTTMYPGFQLKKLDLGNGVVGVHIFPGKD